MSDKVNVQTGEIMPYMDGAPAPVALAQMAQMLTYVEQFVKDILKENEDYGKIPGVDRPSLLQPGAEKICFAFSLSPQYVTLARMEDPERQWVYLGHEWTTENGKRVKVEVEKHARGYFRYEVRCDLVHRTSGLGWSSCIGVCESSERGKETSPANTIIKIAQKRAFVGAAKSAAFLSGRFTCDVEDYKGEQSPRGDDGEGQVTPPPGCARIMQSRYDDLSFCYTCKKKHVEKGQLIVQDAETSKWHSLDCWKKKHPAEKPADNPAEPAEEPSPKNGSYLEQAQRGENAYCALFDADEQPTVEAEIVEARLSLLKAKLGGEPTSNLELASPGTLKMYVKWLADSYKVKKGQSNV